MPTKFFRIASRWFHQKAIRYVLGYIEGTIVESEFFEQLKRNREYQQLYYRASWDVFQSPLLERKLIDGNLERLAGIQKIGLQKRLCSILDFYYIEYSIKVPELAFWDKWERCIPPYLDPSLELMKEMERIDSEGKHTKKWHEERLRALFPYEKNPPRWMQNCEWPLDDNGRHCLFLYQIGDPDLNDYVEYHFRKASGEEMIVVQYD